MSPSELDSILGRAVTGKTVCPKIGQKPAGENFSERLKLKIRNNIMTMRPIKQWNCLLADLMGPPSLEGFQRLHGSCSFFAGLLLKISSKKFLLTTDLINWCNTLAIISTYSAEIIVTC